MTASLRKCSMMLLKSNTRTTINQQQKVLLPTEAATETVVEQSSGEGGGEKAKEQETAQAPAIDLSPLSQTIGYEVKDIDIKGRFLTRKSK